MAILIRENNLISLRTALVEDDGNTATFALMPADLQKVVPHGRSWWAPKDFEWALQDSTWLYRHLRSPLEEEKLASVFPPVLEQDLTAIAFDCPPEFKLLWTDSGNGVAACIDDIPWAFIDEATRTGYSKGILKPGIRSKFMNPWDQKSFQRIFQAQ